MALADGVSFLAASAGTGAFVFATARTSYLTLAQAQAAGALVNGQTVSYLAVDSVTAPTQREWGHGTYSSAGNSIARTTVLGTVSGVTPGAGAPLAFTVPPVLFLTALAEDIITAFGANDTVQFALAGALSSDPAFKFDHVNKILNLAPTSAGGAVFNSFNPNAKLDPTDHIAFYQTYLTDSFSNTPGFSDEVATEIDGIPLHGLNTNTAKMTFILNNLNNYCVAAGQRNIEFKVMTSLGMGDSSIGQYVNGFSGGPINGDEGQGFNLVSRLIQNPTSVTNVPALPTATITSVTRSAVNGTITQNVTAAATVQAVTFAGTPPSVGDYVIIGQQLPSASPTLEPVKITAASAGSISGVFRYNHTNGDTVTPALVLGLSSSFGFGQDRIIVNLSGASYTTGTVSSITGAAFTGSGTTWAANVVGGSATNIGAIALAADNYWDNIFFTSGAGSLDSWYQILSVTSATVLAVFSYSVAADTSYRGYGPIAGSGRAASNYQIRPCARALMVGDNRSPNLPASGVVVCETSTATWTVGNSVICPVCPYPDVTAHQEQMGVWTAGPTMRSWFDVRNVGARMFQTCLNISSGGGIGLTLSNADLIAWDTGINMASVNTALAVVAQKQVMTIGDIAVGTSGKFNWTAGAFIDTTGFNGTRIDLSPDGVNKLNLIKQASGINPDTNTPMLNWQGYCNLAQVSTFGPFLRFSHGTALGTDHFDLRYFSSSVTTTAGAASQMASSISLEFVRDDGAGGVITVGGVGQFSGATGVAVGPSGAAATSNITNKASNSFVALASVWTGSVAAARYGVWRATPASGVNNAPLTLAAKFQDSRLGYLGDPFLIDAWSITETGKMFFGQNNIGNTSPTVGALLDPGNMTAIRTITVPDQAGGLGVARATSGTPASSTATGQPGMMWQDGTFFYLCYDVNKWLRITATFTF